MAEDLLNYPEGLHCNREHVWHFLSLSMMVISAYSGNILPIHSIILIADENLRFSIVIFFSNYVSLDVRL